MSTPVGGGPAHAAREMRSDGSAAFEYWTTAGPVRGPLSLRETDAYVEQEQAMVADPTPLGLAALAIATFTLSAVFAGWFGVLGVMAAIPVVLVVGGIVQFLAGMWAHRRGSMLTATAFGALGGFNATFALLLAFVASRFLAVSLMGDSIRGVTGIFILTFAVLIAGLGVAALRTNRLLAAIFFLLALAYLFDGLGIWTQPLDWFLFISGPRIVGVAVRTGWLLLVGGYLGLIAAVLALYEAVAIVVNSASGQERWPVLGVRHQAVPPPAADMPPETSTMPPAPA